MNKNEWSHEQPLKTIRQIITECNGSVIIAFTRTRFEKGQEFKKCKTIDITNLLLPTTWNHIEGVLSYAFKIPILVIA